MSHIGVKRNKRAINRMVGDGPAGVCSPAPRVSPSVRPMSGVGSVLRLLALGAVLLALAVVAAAPAGANNFGDYYYADNEDHYWVDVNLTPAGSSQFQFGLQRLNATVINTSDDGPTCKTSTDVCGYDGNYTVYGGAGETAAFWADTVAAAICWKGVLFSGDKCDRWGVYFNEWFHPLMNANQELAVGCHELGHTVGLDHGPRKCMHADPGTMKFLGPHNKEHINGRY